MGRTRPRQELLKAARTPGEAREEGVRKRHAHSGTLIGEAPPSALHLGFQPLGQRLGAGVEEGCVIPGEEGLPHPRQASRPGGIVRVEPPPLDLGLRE